MLWILIKGAGRQRFLCTRAAQLSVGNGGSDDLLVNDPQLRPGLLHIRAQDVAAKPLWVKTRNYRIAFCSSRLLLRLCSRWLVAIATVLIMAGAIAVRFSKERAVGPVTLPYAGRLALNLERQNRLELRIPAAQNPQLLSFYLRRSAAQLQITIAGHRLQNLGWPGKRYLFLPPGQISVWIEGRGEHGFAEFERLQLEKPPAADTCAALQKPQTWADYDLLDRCNAVQPSPERSATLSQWRRDVRRRYAEFLFQYQRAIHLQQHESAKAVMLMMRRLIADPWDPRVPHPRP